MIALVYFVLSKSRLEAENAALRHQLIVLRRKARGRAQLTNSDRWFFIQLYRWFPLILTGTGGGGTRRSIYDRWTSRIGEQPLY
jgi:hypothetical protein